MTSPPLIAGNSPAPSSVSPLSLGPPRPYRVKSPSERDGKWLNKRQRNNESVRRSRMKAKMAQDDREGENNALRAENDRLRAENESLRDKVKLLTELSEIKIANAK